LTIIRLTRSLSTRGTGTLTRILSDAIEVGDFSLVQRIRMMLMLDGFSVSDQATATYVPAGSSGDQAIPGSYTIYWAANADGGGSDSNNGLTEGTPKTLRGALALADGAGKGVYIKPSADPYIDTFSYEPVWMQAFSPGGHGTEEAPIIIQAQTPRANTTIMGRIVIGEHTPAIGTLDKDYVHWRYVLVDGKAQARGSQARPCVGPAFIGCDLIHGDIEGTDNSLHWGFGFNWCYYWLAQDCRVTQMTAGLGNLADNTGCFEIFASSDGVLEYCYAEAEEVYSGIGTKAGDCNRNRLRYFTVKNARDGFSGTESAGVAIKSATTFDPVTNARWCDDNIVEYGIIENCIDAVYQRHGSRNTILQHLSTRECDTFFRDWQLTNTNVTGRSNIFVPRAAVTNPRCYYKEDLSGTDFSPYISSSNNNRWPSGTTRFGGSGTTTVNQATWTSGQSMTNRDQLSTNDDPNWVNAAAGDYQPQAAAILNAAHDGTHMGAWQSSSSRFKPYWM
jgi:hypothetical protein